MMPALKNGRPQKVRAPAAAGVFYPASAEPLRAMVQGALSQATREVAAAPTGRAPKGVIAPHAGYRYSGPVAASAYVRVARGRGSTKRVVLIGPAHWVELDALAVSSADVFVTPLGGLQVDIEGRQAALSCSSVVVDDLAHAREHSLEVHLPFIQEVLGEVVLLPLLVGQVPTDAVADVLDTIWGGPETLVVASTDLSHHHDYVTATVLDRDTAGAIVACRPAGVGLDRACGVFAVRGLLEAAQRHHLQVGMVDLRNSGDTAGGRDSVVGYGAFVLN